MIFSIYQLGLIILSLFILIVSADQLVSQADAIAKKFNFSQVLVGLTVVAFGTSAPELMVSLSAALFETPPASDAILGNVIGSNIANLLLVLGFAGLMHKIHLQGIDQKTNLYLFIVTAYFILILSIYSQLTWVHTFIFFVILLSFINHLKNFSTEQGGNENSIETEVSIIKLLLSFLGFFIGGKLFLSESLVFFSNLGMAHTVIGLTILALGTSLPELITLIVAALKKKAAMGIGNVIGSNIMNILFVLFPSIIIVKARGYNFSSLNVETNDLLLLALSTAIIIILILINRSLNRILSIVFVLSYLIYIYRLF
ncbi:sodium:calcium antiporter [Pelagibacteraceae bacterium]|nr:sodium:calcium antiporter [Pelagibacteraceae bacterium]